MVFFFFFNLGEFCKKGIAYFKELLQKSCGEVALAQMQYSIIREYAFRYDYERRKSMNFLFNLLSINSYILKTHTLN